MLAPLEEDSATGSNFSQTSRVYSSPALMVSVEADNIRLRDALEATRSVLFFSRFLLCLDMSVQCCFFLVFSRFLL